MHQAYTAFGTSALPLHASDLKQVVSCPLSAVFAYLHEVPETVTVARLPSVKLKAKTKCKSRKKTQRAPKLKRRRRRR